MLPLDPEQCPGTPEYDELVEYLNRNRPPAYVSDVLLMQQQQDEYEHDGYLLHHA